jgi:hypothetical protein
VTFDAVPDVFWFNVGTSAAWIVDITTFVPLPRKYDPLVTAPAKAFIANCAVVCPEPPFAIGKAVPDNETANVPLEVIGEPVTDKNAGTDIATEVTVPVVGVAHDGTPAASVKTCPFAPAPNIAVVAVALW